MRVALYLVNSISNENNVVIVYKNSKVNSVIFNDVVDKNDFLTKIVGLIENHDFLTIEQQSGSIYIVPCDKILCVKIQ